MEAFDFDGGPIVWTLSDNKDDILYSDLVVTCFQISNLPTNILALAKLGYKIAFREKPIPSPKFSRFVTRISSYSSVLLFIVFAIISAVAAFGTFYTTLLITEINGET
ncbi:hypothetical protein L1887_02541 [Cichorium endivia]|nr:hypothetical protein L1887_02541 [Cichorium endivia]